MLSNILLSTLGPYIDEIIGDHRCGFWHNRSTTDQIFCICQILEKQWECNETVHQLFIDFKKAYDSVRREVLYSILIEFGVSMKLLRLINMRLNETYSKVRIGKYLSDRFPDRLCGLVVRVLGYRSGGPGSIPGTTRKKKKESSGSWMGSTQPREYNWGATW
jgi:hypothetical protein